MKIDTFQIIKYLFRTLHISTFGLLFGNMLFDYLFGARNLSDKYLSIYKKSMMYIGIILMISGLTNMIILIKDNKYTKNMEYKRWKNLLIFKFFATLSLTPLLDKLVHDKFTEHLLLIRLCFAVPLFLLSPYLRFYREGNLESNIVKFMPNPIENKAN